MRIDRRSAEPDRPAGDPSPPASTPGKRTLTDQLAPVQAIASGQAAGSRDAADARAVIPTGGAPSGERPTLAMLFGGHDGGRREAAVHASAAQGIATPATALPHAEAIQRSFGHHDISSIQAHVGPEAAASARGMGADAYATGNHVVLGDKRDLFTVAHEAAHVVQQRGGVQLSAGVGATGDRYEQHANEVASLVVQGASAERVLDSMAGSGTGGGMVQKLDDQGLADDTQVKVFGSTGVALAKSTPAMILDQLRLMANAQLTGLGVPPIAERDFILRPGGGAEFVSNYWTLMVGKDELEDAAAQDDEAKQRAIATIVGSIYHECRHAEQTFLMLTHSILHHGPRIEVLPAIRAAGEVAVKSGDAAKRLAGREAFVETLLAQEAGSDEIQQAVVAAVAARNRKQDAIVAAVEQGHAAAIALRGLLAGGPDVDSEDPAASPINAAFEKLTTSERVLAAELPLWDVAEEQLRAAYRAYIGLEAEADANRAGDKARDIVLGEHKLALPTITQEEIAARYHVLQALSQTFSTALGAFVLRDQTNALAEVEIFGMTAAQTGPLHAELTTLVDDLGGPRGRIAVKAPAYTEALGTAMETSRSAI